MIHPLVGAMVLVVAETLFCYALFFTRLSDIVFGELPEETEHENRNRRC